MRRKPSKYDILLPLLTAGAIESNKRRIVVARREDGLAEAELRRDLQIGEAYLVNEASQVSLHRAVHTLAGYFKQEFRYDFNQYPVENADDREAWLWVADEGTGLRAIGAAVFDQESVQLGPDGARRWQCISTLSFVWIHPYARGEGLLSASWTGWQDRYPGFEIEQPWSPAMEGFLRRHPHVYVDGTSTAQMLERRRE